MHKERSIGFAMNKIEVNLSEKKINLINDTYQKELKYWNEAAFKKALAEDEANRLEGLAPPGFSLLRKPLKNAKETDIDGIIIYLKFKYSPNIR